MALPVLSAAPVCIRHIKLDAGAGAVTVLGASLAAQPARGVNGRRGYQSGSYEPAMNEEGTATLRLANIVGDDGILHRRRFRVFTDPDYHPGDEWVEIKQSGRVLFIGTPLGATKRRGELVIRLGDPQWMLRKQRETAAGFWTHAPRDVFEHYTKAWRTLIADEFNSGADPAKWTSTVLNGGTTTNQTGTVLLSAGPNANGSSAIAAAAAFWPGLTLASERAWRLEMTYNRDLLLFAGVSLTLDPSVADSSQIRLDLGSSSNTATARIFPPGGATVAFVQTKAPQELVAKGATLAIEGRDRWVLFYVDGRLVAQLEQPAWTAGVVYRPAVRVANATASVGNSMEVSSVLLRRADPYLMRGADKGDYRLPGTMPSGGLRGSYFDDADLRSLGDVPAYYSRVLAPTREPYARRQDTTINFPFATPPTWQPAGPAGGDNFSVRWTGSIFLDLAAADVTLRIASWNGCVRLYVGKTMFGQHLLQVWTAQNGGADLVTGSLRTHLGSVTGWYPIVLEYSQNLGAAGLVLQQNIGGGAAADVPAASLSPYGIYEQQVRYDSHGEQLKAIAETFGLQYRCEPRSLESGLFPGELVPRVRVGRDTDKILEPAESTDVTVEIDAEDVADTLLADAAGISDPFSGAQLTAENINYSGVLESVVADRHMMVLTEYESLTDITDPQMLRNRLDSLLGLRTRTWEEVSARPRGHRERRDTFPLTGQLALFAWEPGDAVRVNDPDIDLEDTVPRQIIAPSWSFVPDGLGAPAVRFRQRPRSQQNALRALVRSALLPQRNYQGQLVVINGTIGISPTVASIPDDFSRVSLPASLDDVVRAELVVHAKGDTSAGTLAINGVSTGTTISLPGRYDVTAFVARPSTGPQMFARITGHTGSVQYALELLVRV